MIPRRTRYILLAFAVALSTLLLLRHEHVREQWEALPPLPIQDFRQFKDLILQNKKQSSMVVEHEDSTAIYSTSFKPGIPITTGNYTRTIVVPKLKKEDTSWLDEEFPNTPKAVYVVDDRNASLHPPKNKGNEAMVYLSYIIDHYDTLAETNIFIHAHRWAWHNNDLFNMDTAMTIRHLSDARVAREGYMNLRCMFYPGCPSWMRLNAKEEVEEKKEEMLVARSWEELFPNDPMPDILGQPCCSQFAVSGERIRAIPLDEYKRIRNWLLKTTLSRKNVLCPAMHECYCDGFGACFKNEDEFQQWFKVRFEIKRDEEEMNTWILAEEKYTQLTKQGHRKAAALVARPPEGRIKELKLSIDERWFMLDEGRDTALKNGMDPGWRARVRDSAGKRNQVF
ncbi:hypothetical protein E2P81_ATG00916 [Venturia nashicola]|uniref:Uncharacterized protein n=1 Tax=Venturia nashicola TaxID=86259 RepID=A0A4Z1PAK6_9PEZI|nr:hypothetical protein E6O75_ATG00935 [Venturia nashicola]TLD38373.1 hypothetical protein E2P81_ATG00916 [Venturia nashicola]